LINQKTSRIVPAMKRTSILLALLVLGALPAVAQTTEFGFIVGGSRRFVEGAQKESGVEFHDSTFSFANNSFELFWATQLEPDVYFRVKGGRIETPVAISYRLPNVSKPFRRDADGEVQHLEANVEYRFSEAFGTTGLFAGLGYYRTTAENEESSSNFGVNAGVTADFPISRRYGVILEGSYHWLNSDFDSRYMTLGGGLRVSF
jgi:hypothetical protein